MRTFLDGVLHDSDCSHLKNSSLESVQVPAMSSLVLKVVEGGLDLLRGYGAASTAWGPLLSLSRTGVLALLQQISIGQLLIIEQDGAQTLCGQSTVAGLPAEPKTELRVHQDAFWVRLALFADMGFAESYMLGEVDCPDLTAFFRVRSRVVGFLCSIYLCLQSADFHLESRTAGQCDDMDFIPFIHRERIPAKH